jgi:hypothetical protein
MPFFFVEFNSKTARHQEAAEVYSVPFFPQFSYKWMQFRKNLVSLASPLFREVGTKKN